jgi:hypothetical protein
MTTAGMHPALLESEAELRVLEARAERAGITLSEWVRYVLLGSLVEMETLYPCGGRWP